MSHCHLAVESNIEMLLLSVKVICSAFYLWSNFQFYLLERENTWFFALFTSLVITWGRMILSWMNLLPCFLQFLLSFWSLKHTVRRIARPNTIICLRSKSNKTTPKNRNTVSDPLDGGIYSGIESGTKTFQKLPRLFFPFQYRDLTVVPRKSRPTSRLSASFRCLWESTVNTKISIWDSKVNEKRGFSCSLECCGSGFTDS